jgi:hypothetical protein
MANFWDNFKHALHMFRANPGFTFAAVAALALGIGINTAIFTVVDAVLLKPLTYPDPDRITQLLITSPQGDVVSSGMSISDFVLFEQQTSVFQEVAAYDWGGPGSRPQQDSQPGRLARHAADDRGSGGRHLRGLWPYPPDRQLALWGEGLGSNRICNCTGNSSGGGAAGSIAARDARLAAGPDRSVAG